jgi:hypothetical protein
LNHFLSRFGYDKQNVQPYLPKGERQAKVSEKVKDGPNMSKSEK